MLRLEQEQRKLKDELKSLKKNKDLGERPTIQQKKELALNMLSQSSYLGPTQIRCLLNSSTKGRGWTLQEKQKALKTPSKRP